MYFCDEHRGITRYYEILKSSVCEKYQLRQMEYDILMFLYNNPQHNTAADIVRYRKSTKSHVSMSLKVLEEKGLIERRIDKDNKKRVEIYLLDSADDIIKDGIRVQKQFAKDMFNGLTDDEIALCKQIFKKICNNAEACIKAAQHPVMLQNFLHRYEPLQRGLRCIRRSCRHRYDRCRVSSLQLRLLYQLGCC